MRRRPTSPPSAASVTAPSCGPGPITLEDLYHFIPIGPMIAKGTIKGKQLKSSARELDRRFAQSRCRQMDRRLAVQLLAACAPRSTPTRKPASGRSNIMVADRATNGWKPLDPEADYTYASYYYARDPDLINTTPAQGRLRRQGQGRSRPRRVEVVTRYLARLPNRTTSPKTGRLKLVKPVPAASSGSPEIQPWRGAVQSTSAHARTGPSSCPAQTAN